MSIIAEIQAIHDTSAPLTSPLTDDAQAIFSYNQCRGHRAILLAALSSKVIGISTEHSVCDEILDIMRTYDEQDAKGYIDPPGGLENMGDVWKLLDGWRQALTPKPTGSSRG